MTKRFSGKNKERKKKLKEMDNDKYKKNKNRNTNCYLTSDKRKNRIFCNMNDLLSVKHHQIVVVFVHHAHVIAVREFIVNIDRNGNWI